MISDNDVKKLASLARIKISPEEEKSLAQDMENILNYVQQIQEVSSSAVGSTEKVKNVLREDSNPHESGMYTKDILDNVPHEMEGYINVKKIL